MPGTDLSSNLKLASSPIRARFTWRTLIAPALVAAFAVGAPTTASAQDIGPGKSKPAKKAPAKKAPAKKAPARPAKKAPKKAPAKKAPAKKSPAKKAPATPAKKAPAAPAKKAPPVETTGAKKSLDGTKGPAEAPPAAKTDDGAAPAIKSLGEGFEKILAPHGAWVDDEAYGKLWILDAKEVGKNFAPYRTGGRWAATDDGSWSWVSDYDWGNVPFHYGRWLWTKKKQWAWSPGETYAPAWVIWRVGDAGYDFVGWAPMAPEPKPVKKAKPDAAAKAVSKKAGARKAIAGEAEAGEASAEADEKAAKKAAPTTKVLPFYFVANKHLFLQGVEKYVLTDRKLGHAVQKHSEIYEGNRIEGRKGFFKPATPTFSEIRVPAFAIPRSRLSALAEEVAPLTLDAVRGLVSAAAPSPAKKAAAAAEADEAAEPASEKAAPAEESKPAKRSFATPPAAKKQDGKTRYRCWWTNSRPRIWRCGY